MRVVVKDLANQGYLPLRGRQSPSTSGEATRAWDRFGNKSSVLNALLAEQYHLCCYSEVRADEEELGYHIEHVENKSQNPARTFDPKNLAACAIDSNSGFIKLKAQSEGLSVSLFGGHAPLKAQSVDMTQFIHPYQAISSAPFFRYLSDGRIIPNPNLAPSTVEYLKAEYTIRQLNLDSPYLRAMRKSWWQELDGFEKSSSDHSEAMRKLAQVHLLPSDGKLNRFFSLSRQFYGVRAEQVLLQHAPQLL
ncbi:TIGR02646 family protein [Limnohabitans sp. 2KL-17]|uniref:retron system putative HNH endonuclease n=1 Tax=Limnohabitans sp. 2KL-17 TaxID=1100704 RepID=UPI000D374E49|nr:retron system putative HNH endonuclease [Limnohabitans sp. 2KL-17]PUE61712.1 TIGR02646 family protein [Limnohabitans sp. 2KL-17]